MCLRMPVANQVTTVGSAALLALAPGFARRQALTALAVLGLSLAVAASAAPKPPKQAAPAVPVVGRAAPPLASADADGKKRSLAELRGRPVALFFFCGCQACQECAPLWAQVQRSDFMRAENSQAAPVTVVAYLGDVDQTRAFAATHGLDPKRTVLLPDPRNRLALAYRSSPCPRAWIIDVGGVIRYTNNKADEKPHVAPAGTIMGRAQDALERLVPPARE